jgi:hypothetical protein
MIARLYDWLCYPYTSHRMFWSDARLSGAIRACTWAIRWGRLTRHIPTDVLVFVAAMPAFVRRLRLHASCRWYWWRRARA